MRLIKALSRHYGISGNQAKKLLDQRQVFINGKRVWKAGYEVKPSDRITAEISENRSSSDFTLLLRSGEICIYNKPPGLLTCGKNSLEELLNRQNTKKIQAVHRLDKDTSGAVCFCVSTKMQNKIKKIFQDRLPEKKYLAIVEGSFPEGIRKISQPLDGKPALSEFMRLSHSKGISLVEVTISTGRTHQIRKHLSGLGFRLAGEKQYRTDKPAPPALQKVSRQMLHAWKLSLPEPDSDRILSAQAPPPEDFLVCMKNFNLHLKEENERSGRK